MEILQLLGRRLLQVRNLGQCFLSEMGMIKVLRFVTALLVSVCLAASLNSFIWPQSVMWRAFILYLICAAAFAIWIGLPVYSYLRSRRKDSLINAVVVPALIYGVVYFVIRVCLSLSTSVESIDGVKVVDGGLLTLHGLALVLLAAVEVAAIGCLANLAFWLIFARSFRKPPDPIKVN